MPHGSPKAARRAILYGNQHLMMPRQLVHQNGIERLHEACIRHRGGETARRQLIGRLQRIRYARAEGQNGDF